MPMPSSRRPTNSKRRNHGSGCLGGGFLLSLWRRLTRRRQSTYSSHQALEVRQNVYGTRHHNVGVPQRTISHGRLRNDEPQMSYHLEPSTICRADPDDRSSGKRFSMDIGLPDTGADCSLIKWLQQREDNGIVPLATFKIQGIPAQTYIRGDIKLLIKSLIMFVQSLHNQGKCASGGTFRAKNISVVGGGLRFDELELGSLTEKLQQDNYNSIECMIMTVILREKAKQLPHDMQHLLELLKNPRPHKYLISTHVALMNLKSCRNLYMSLWDTKKAMNPTAYSKWQNAVRDLDIQCWSKSISKGSPLLEVYKGGKYNGGDKFNLIRFVRNAAAHLNDHSGRGQRFQFEHISLIITATFPTLLAELQERLHHYGILPAFL